MSHQQLRDTIFTLLDNHGFYKEFMNVLSKPLPVASAQKEPVDDIWSIEIHPREGICKFSKPLIIASEGTETCRVVRLAHSWADVWDITYDPLYEFRLSRNSQHPSTWDWIPVNRYSTHQDGFTVFETEAQIQEAIAYSKEWAVVLMDRGYGETNQAQIKRLSDPYIIQSNL
ncbi:hypothetical protein BDR26DRAFT_1005052 [Obelidium mucronatum]|nr:hypothetical protein BDR26DRAFT_1005052 [Obelidium mucronatum]